MLTMRLSADNWRCKTVPGCQSQPSGFALNGDADGFVFVPERTHFHGRVGSYSAWVDQISLGHVPPIRV